MVQNAKAVAQNPADQSAAARWRGANQEVRKVTRGTANDTIHIA